MKKYLIINFKTALHLWLYLTFLFFTSPASAFGLYDNCIFSWEFGDVDRQVTVVRPVGEVCYERCHNECSSFSRLSSSGQELNADHISECLLACQDGRAYTGRVREPNPDDEAIYPPFVDGDIVTTSTYCSTNQNDSDSALHAFYSSNISIDPANKYYKNENDEEVKGQRVRIWLNRPPGTNSNVVYMCGFKSVVLEPKMWYLRFSDWKPESKWKNRSTSIGDWHGRNHIWTNTGIDVKDGDYLSIGYQGKYRSRYFSEKYHPRAEDKSLLLRAADNPTLWSMGTGPSIKLPGDKLETGLEDKEKDNPASFGSEYHENNLKHKKLGLSPFISAGGKQDEDGNYTDELAAYIKFSGFLEGFSDNFSRLGLRHYDTESSNHPSTNYWDDNIGGYFTVIDWKGCAFKDGERLQYAVLPRKGGTENEPIFELPEGKTWADLDWKDVPSTIKDGPVELVFSPDEYEAGQIYFRIEKLPGDYGSQSSVATSCNIFDPVCLESYYDTKKSQKYKRSNTTGEYYVTAQLLSGVGDVSQVLSNLINSVRELLFDETKGTVPRTFNMLTSAGGLRDAIQASLILFVAITGIRFLLGFSKINQQEGIIRIFKFSVVAALISDYSWDFFNKYLFTIFIDGSLEILARISAEFLDGYDSLALIEDPSRIFDEFEKPIKKLFNRAVWLKILALSMSTLLGLLLSIIIGIAAITYAMCIGRAIMIYLASLIGTGLLLAVAPIFICFLLFEYTKNMFESWYKMLISYALQPILVFAFLATLNYLLLLGLYMSLSYTACEQCFLRLYISGLLDVCIIPGYITLSAAHLPPGDPIGLPLRIVGPVFYFIIIALAMNTFCSFSSSLAQTIAKGSFWGGDLSQIASEAGPVNVTKQATNKALFVAGLDYGTRSERSKRKANKEAGDKQNTRNRQ